MLAYGGAKQRQTDEQQRGKGSCGVHRARVSVREVGSKDLFVGEYNKQGEGLNVKNISLRMERPRG